MPMVVHDKVKNAGSESMGRILPLLIVVLLVFSMISTYFILILNPGAPASAASDKRTGDVKLTILPRESSQQDTTKGVVSLTVLPG